MPRLFTGLEIPAEIAERLSFFRGGLPGARWIEPSDYHITLRFLGATAANGSLELLQSLPAQSALSAALNPIDARLRRELDEYFEPFEAALEHQLSAHHRCFTERSRLKRSRPKTVGR